MCFVDYAGKKSKWRGLDQVPDRPRVASQHCFQESADYNNEPAQHLRNGQSSIPNFIPRRHDSTIGEVLQPNQNGHGPHHGLHHQLEHEISGYARHM